MAGKSLADQLAAPFGAKQIKWRVGSTTHDKAKGMALPYIDARAVMDRLDQVVGIDRWQDSYEFVGSRTICTLQLAFMTTGQTGDGERLYRWIPKSDGAGDTSYEGDKGSISDAFKRAAVKWGVGRFLYDMDTEWVEVEAVGNPNKPNFKISRKGMTKLNAIANKLPGPKIKDEAPPADEPKGKGKAENPPPPAGEDPPGVILLRIMRARCIELGVDDAQAGQILNEIIMVDLALEKNTETLGAEMETITAKIRAWAPHS